MITDVPGVLAGHWTGEATGVTVVVLPPETVGSVEIRGGAPATRETAVLDPLATVEQVDAIVLSGGSAFGLATADGVMLALAELGRGFPTRGGPVPIVPAAAIFDLVVAGDERPGAAEGRAALDAALDPDAPALATGRVGAGRGASVAKWRGGEHGSTGGVGSASARDGEVVVGALVVVNAVGDIMDGDGGALVASQAPADALGFPEEAPFEGDSTVATSGGAGTNTTIAVVVTNARCTKVECHLLAQSANHGLARAIHPSHTRHDGDLAFACATGTVDAHLDRLRVMVTEVTAEAVRDAVAYHRDTT
ncbi:MAG TPA: P1 family peptidase [Acidimicrobiia bacterium]|nr:P1 family peptidase [Acidimicrobiia bacterium]